jgi:cell division protein FtsW (lipid II flippase)
VLVLILLQPDFGTAVSVGTVVVALLWVVGTPMRIFGALVGRWSPRPRSWPSPRRTGWSG